MATFLAPCCDTFHLVANHSSIVHLGTSKVRNSSFLNEFLSASNLSSNVVSSVFVSIGVKGALRKNSPHCKKLSLSPVSQCKTSPDTESLCQMPSALGVGPRKLFGNSPNLVKRKILVRPYFGQVRRVERNCRGLFERHDLHIECPQRKVTIGNGMVQS